MEPNWTLRMDLDMFERLQGHLFPGDEDEHGAVIAAGICQTQRGVRLLARDLFVARDGIDFVPGVRGYRRLTPEFVADKIRYCRDEQLAYLAIHNHGGDDHVAFSGPDNSSHERGYPALIDISGLPVGALVFAPNAVAADIWAPDGSRRGLEKMAVVGMNLRTLHNEPPAPPPVADQMYDRQVRWLGERGQFELRNMKVGVIGAGGVGMPLLTMLARLGVGSLVAVDPDRVEPTNLPRLDARRMDGMLALRRFPFLRGVADRMSTSKVRVVRRHVRRANRHIDFRGLAINVADPRAAAELVDCDFLFLAADSHIARVVFNAVSHQYLIPGIQLGTRIETDEVSGEVGEIRSNVRLVLPDVGCLRCNGLISASKLQDEAVGERERERNRYIDEVPAPSVITFNSSLAAQAASDFLLMAGGLFAEEVSPTYLRIHPRRRSVQPVIPAEAREACRDCGAGRSRRARGDSVDLPVMQP